MTDGGMRRYQLIAGAIFGIACIGYLITILHLGIETEVMRARFENADAIFRGEIPVMEYPPFALAFMLVPRLFASTEYGYNVVYVAWVFIFFVLGLTVVCKLAERFGKDEKKAMFAYLVLMLLMLEFVVDRYDVFPMVLTLLSFYFLVTKRYVWAFVLLSLGTMTKLYPAILFPLYTIFLANQSKWAEMIKGISAFVFTVLAIVVPIMIMEPDMINFFLEYHTDRPLQVESVAASLIYPLSMIGITDVWIEYGYGSDNLMGAWPDAVAPWLTPLMIASILVLYILYAHKIFNRVGESYVVLGTVILLAILLFIAIGKVFSSQYLIWIIFPIIFIMMMSNTKCSNILFLISIIIILLTQLNFAYSIGYVGGGNNINDLGMMIILARNVMLLSLTYFIIKTFYGNVICQQIRQ